MSGISSRIATWAFAKQSGKGVPAASPTFRYKQNGAPSLAPLKERGRFAETDSGRDQGGSFTSKLSVGGDIPIYLRPIGFSSLSYLAMGANADTAGTNELQTVTIDATGGTFKLSFLGIQTTAIAENAAAAAVQTALEGLTSIGTGNVAVAGSAGGPYAVTFQGALGLQDVPTLVADGTLLTGGTGASVVVTTPGVAASHLATPANDLPWFTCWRMVGNVIFEKFVDCKMGALRVEGAAGGPMGATLSILGIKSQFLASDPVLAPDTSAPYIYPEFNGLMKIDTIAQRIHRFSWGVDNGISDYQADDYFPADIDPGGRTFSLSLSTRFTGPTAFPKYREYFYGSDAGTDLTPVVATHPIDITIQRDASKSIQWLMPQVTFAGVPVQGDPGGAPIEIDLTCEVETPSTGVICSIVTKDSTAVA